MLSRRVKFGTAVAAICTIMVSGMAFAAPQLPAVAPSVNVASPWLALAATQGQAELSSLCYYDPARRNWIPADSNRATESRTTDPSPAYRDAGGAILSGRCGSPAPIAPLAVIAATVATAVYIAADDNDDGEPISPG